ncbi:MAG: GNAT family N-acetyltransferase [Lachnospiraceae bacterium]|nr:GNAT family N-acetyltransferase [Lachnospiraceae bacterium]
MNIRKADKKDASAICKISCEDLGYECDDEFVLRRLIELDNRREIVFVAETDNIVVGYIHAEVYRTLYFDSMINILGLAVFADYRRRGVGKALLHQAEKWAKELGINKVRLNSGGSRKEAHEFYRAMGYDNEKEQIRFMKSLV